MPHKDKEARRKYHAEWRERNRAHVKRYKRKHYWETVEQQRVWAKKSRLKRSYKLTLDEHDRMKAQGCAICGSFDRLHIDHDHQSGDVRGVLCGNHNRALGLFADNTEHLMNAVNYLKESKSLHGVD